MGDETQAGHAEYTRYDGAEIGLSYDVEGDIQVYGEVGQQTEIQLGTLADPNLMPLVSYSLNMPLDEDGTTIEATGQLDTLAYNTQLVEDHPIAGMSYYFNQEDDSYLSAPAQDNIKPTDAVSFRVDIKPQTSGGEVFSIAGGAHKLMVNSDNSLTYTIHNAQGKHEVTSAPLTQQQWHEVAGQYHKGKLTLQVNSQINQSDVDNSTLNYGITSKGLTVGEQYTGHISGLRFFNPNSQPLVTFDDGSTQKALTLANTQTDLKVKSNGQLNANGQSMQHLRVGINYHGQKTYVGVVDKTLFTQIASYQYERYKPEGYALVYERKKYVGVPFIPTAHAFSFSDVWEGATSAVKGAVSFLIPFESLQEFYKQANYLIKDDSRFDSFEMAMAGIEIFTIIPVAKPLKALTFAMKKIFRPLKGKPFMGALGGVVGKLGEDVINGKFDRVIDMLPMLIIVGEMALNSEARESLLILVDSISSADDIFIWADYLKESINDDDPLALDNNLAMAPPSLLSTALFGSVAYAKNRAKKDENDKLENAAKASRKLVKTLSKFKNLPNKQKLVEGVESAVKAMKGATTKEFKSFLKSEKALSAAMGIGSAAFVRLLKNSGNLRMSPATIVGLLAYIESRREPDICTSTNGCIPFDSEVRRKILSNLYFNAFTRAIFTDQYGEPSNSGALFQLMMVSINHLSYELGDSANKVVDIESTFKLNLYGQNKLGVERLVGKQERRIDIVLAGSNPSGELGVSNKWIEVKSLSGYKRNSSTGAWRESGFAKKLWARYEWADRKTSQKGKVYTPLGSVHKEFFLDRVAQNGYEDNKIFKSDIQWYLQSFTRATVKGYDKNQIKYAREQIRQLPTSKPHNDGRHYISLGFEHELTDNVNYFVGSTLSLFSIKSWILKEASDEALDLLFEDFPKEAIEKLMQVNY
ncbi:LamG-like jellyroll fold domain-containing protein [Saccharobesus litoralis]|uniref:LamG-like jellyroll fold domain-containing protein n=1 Tax=Saccharobesus litoralis TaxID=2172099 RepID=UPI00131EF75F|nr:LamG-like jellyroll fold domain-containing protein [Saccharobesus litoralis]